MLRRHLHWMLVKKTRRFNFEMLKKPYQQMQREEEKVPVVSFCCLFYYAPGTVAYNI
ncbi:hypothetical protein DPMN_121164 [Dreissena polymorpha]|uniref:Uncharacterized protein n=1 Tax=Dreissena polymorpha TaxID=45954 RepID=A0A9D4GLL7_DREPO|nr:hypothetical protein DPMN_121164 [Dreissena polymorpha]